MILYDVMEELASALRPIPGLKVYAFPGEDVVPPAATVRWPTSIDFDASMQRGLDRMEIDIEIAVSPATAARTTAAVSPFVAGSGASSVKLALETYTYSTIHTVKVDRVSFEAVDIAGVQYVAAVLTASITGPGT